VRGEFYGLGGFSIRPASAGDRANWLAMRCALWSDEDWARGLGYKEMASDDLLDNLASHDWHGAQGFEEAERLVVFRKGL